MFISVEGGEGAGKTTLIEGLRDHLVAQGHEVVLTREPGGTDLGERIRQWLLHGKEGLDAQAELQLFLAVRAQHLAEVIRPAISRGAIVLCDRFNDSTVAYQGFGRNLGAESVAEQCLLACSGQEPDLTLFLDLPAVEGLARLEGDHDRIESAGLNFHEKVREGFHWRLQQDSDRMVQLNAKEAKEVVLALAIAAVEERLQTKV